MFAVIVLQGHQYIVKKGMQLEVDRIKDKEISDVFEVPEVLSVFDEKGEKVQLGKPFVKGAKVVCEYVAQTQGKKIRVVKFRRKNRYERTIGFRSKYTLLSIKDVVVNE